MGYGLHIGVHLWMTPTSPKKRKRNKLPAQRKEKEIKILNPAIDANPEK